MGQNSLARRDPPPFIHTDRLSLKLILPLVLSEFGWAALAVGGRLPYGFQRDAPVFG